jgi:putative exosortase-associated protein (TIGR04073 family)
MKKGLIICMALLMIFSFATTCFAQDMGKKLARGLANVLTGWVEIPKNVYDTSVEDNIFSGLTVGLVKGLGMAIVRTGAGVYETVTFPFPIPEDFAPVLEPEFVFSE